MSYLKEIKERFHYYCQTFFAGTIAAKSQVAQDKSQTQHHEDTFRIHYALQERPLWLSIE